jgi:hypothetical protein
MQGHSYRRGSIHPQRFCLRPPKAYNQNYCSIDICTLCVRFGFRPSAAKDREERLITIHLAFGRGHSKQPQRMVGRGARRGAPTGMRGWDSLVLSTIGQNLGHGLSLPTRCGIIRMPEGTTLLHRPWN